MYVCLCHGVTEKDLKESIQKGNYTFCDIMQSITIAKKCKKCVPNIVNILKEEKHQQEIDLIYTEIKS
jgi:bacterioferritin-associated ferredoxin